MKKLAILLIAFMIINIVFLSGCNKQKATSDTTKQNIIIENEPPFVYGTSDVTSGDAPLKVNFYGYASDSDGEIVSYYWNLDDGSYYSDAESCYHTFETSGTYEVTITATDNDGAKATDTITITVTKGITKPEITEHNAYSYTLVNTNVVIVGTVKNVAEKPVSGLKIKATLYDSADNIIKTNLHSLYDDLIGFVQTYDYVEPNIINPGEIGCFDITINDVPYYDHYDLEIVSCKESTTWSDTENLELNDIKGEISYYSDYELTGEIKNIGTSVFNSVNIYAILYDSSGKIVAVEGSYSYMTLYAGQKESFTISVYDYEVDISSISDYKLLIDYSKY